MENAAFLELEKLSDILLDYINALIAILKGTPDEVSMVECISQIEILFEKHSELNSEILSEKVEELKNLARQFNPVTS